MSEWAIRMKIKLPKDLRGVVFPRVLMIEMNDFDIDLFLPALFFTILAGGRGRARRANDATAIDRYVDALAEHRLVDGFNDEDGHRSSAGWFARHWSSPDELGRQNAVSRFYPPFPIPCCRTNRDSQRKAADNAAPMRSSITCCASDWARTTRCGLCKRRLWHGSAYRRIARARRRIRWNDPA